MRKFCIFIHKNYDKIQFSEKNGSLVVSGAFPVSEKVPCGYTGFIESC